MPAKASLADGSGDERPRDSRRSCAYHSKRAVRRSMRRFRVLATVADAVFRKITTSEMLVMVTCGA